MKTNRLEILRQLIDRDIDEITEIATKVKITPRQFFLKAKFEVSKVIGLEGNWSDPINPTLDDRYIELQYKPFYDFSSRTRKGCIVVSCSSHYGFAYPYLLELIRELKMTAEMVVDSENDFCMKSLEEEATFHEWLKQLGFGKVPMSNLSPTVRGIIKIFQQPIVISPRKILLKKEYLLERGNGPQSLSEDVKKALAIFSKIHYNDEHKRKIAAVKKDITKAIVTAHHKERQGLDARDEHLTEAVWSADLRVMEGALFSNLDQPRVKIVFHK